MVKTMFAILQIWFDVPTTSCCLHFEQKSGTDLQKLDVYVFDAAFKIITKVCRFFLNLSEESLHHIFLQFVSNDRLRLELLLWQNHIEERLRIFRLFSLQAAIPKLIDWLIRQAKNCKQWLFTECIWGSGSRSTPSVLAVQDIHVSLAVAQ